jgi:hypothetical protein
MAAGYCHCTRCQQRTGSAASAQARIDGRMFRLVQGDALVKGWRHPDGGFETTRPSRGSSPAPRLLAFEARRAGLVDLP